MLCFASAVSAYGIVPGQGDPMVTSEACKDVFVTPNSEGSSRATQSVPGVGLDVSISPHNKTQWSSTGKQNGKHVHFKHGSYS